MMKHLISYFLSLKRAYGSYKAKIGTYRDRTRSKWPCRTSQEPIVACIRISRTGILKKQTQLKSYDILSHNQALKEIIEYLHIPQPLLWSIAQTQFYRVQYPRSITMNSSSQESNLHLSTLILPILPLSKKINL